MVHVLTKLWRT